MAKETGNYERLKALSREVGADIKDLLAMAPDNDPFYIGTPTHHLMAKWFRGVWEERGFLGRGGVHLRRAHYQLLGSQKHDNSPYENNTVCWHYLNRASKYARILGYVDPEDIIDRRNPDPHIYFYRPEEEQEKGFKPHIPEWNLPTPDADLLSQLDENLVHPYLTPTGYEYDDFYQPYHLEVWVERSTMNDILVPLCASLGTNLVTGVGYMTITSVVALLRRIEATGKPTRILYVSDFDRAGKKMPSAVARQLEFWRGRYAPEADIRLQPIVLTQEQIDIFELPSLNIQEEEGEGPTEDIVELDALEAYVPGKLAEIVAKHINEFRDDKLAERFEQAEKGAQNAVDNTLEEKLGDQLKQLDELKEEAQPIVERYERLLERLAARMERELRPVQVKLDAARLACSRGNRFIFRPSPAGPPGAGSGGPGRRRLALRLTPRVRRPATPLQNAGGMGSDTGGDTGAPEGVPRMRYEFRRQAPGTRHLLLRDLPIAVAPQEGARGQPETRAGKRQGLGRPHLQGVRQSVNR